MKQNIVIGILIIIVIGVGGFAFIQTQNLNELESASTQAISNLQDTGTQFADDTKASATQSANNQLNFAGTVTQNAGNTIATDTQFAENADATASQFAEIMDEIEASATQSANDAGEIAGLATQNSVDAIATGTEFANRFATQSALSTDTANSLATQRLELTASALIFNDTQATSSAQMLEMENRLALFNINGDGLGGLSAEILPDFVLFEGQGYEMLIRDNLSAGDFVSSKILDLENALNQADLDDILIRLEKQNDDFLFFAIDTELIDGFPSMTASLIREDALTDNVRLEDYIAGALLSLQGDFALITSDIVAINGQATGRIIIDQEFDEITVRQLQYIFSLENQFYVLTFSVPISEYARLRESLEITAHSLRIR